MIPLSSKAQTVIKNLIAWKEFRGESKALDAPLFASRNSGRPLSRFQAHLILKDAFEACRLSGKVTTHSMRKTFGTRLYTATKNMMLVKELLGHKSISTTQKYIGVGIDEMIQAVELL
jgi:integrase/recombinase XerC